MGLISPGGETLLDFLELRQVLSTYDRDLRDSVADVTRFPSRGSRDLWLSLEAFPRGFPTRLSHRAVQRATVLCVDPRLESRGSEGKTGFPGME